MNDDIVVVGKVGAPYGLKGWSKVFSYTNPIENLIDYQPWLLQNGEIWQTIAPVKAKLHQKVIVAQFENCLYRDQAKLMTHRKIAIYRSQLPTLATDEYYWNDLIGLTVLDIDGKVLGKVQQLLETGSNDVLIIQSERDFAVPMLMGEVIKNVDLTLGQMTIDWEPIY